MKSIIQKNKCCFLCGTCYGLEYHHIYYGNPLRKVSDENGFTCWLCARCHRDTKYGVHGNRNQDLFLKKICQAIYEQKHGRTKFMALIGRNYLDEDVSQ